jgi:hypothetical protein
VNGDAEFKEESEIPEIIPSKADVEEMHCEESSEEE